MKLHTTSYEPQPLSDRTFSRFRERNVAYELTTRVDLIHDCITSLSEQILKFMEINPSIKIMDRISQEWAQGQINTPYWYLLNGVFSIARMGVPIFFMCSGYGMLQKKRSIREIYTKYIYNLLFIYVMWMQVYGISSILRMIIHREGNIRVYLNAYIKAIIFDHYHVWFIFALCGLYAIVPLLERAAEEKRLLQYGIVISFGATILFPYTGMLPGFSRMEYTLGSLDLHNLTGYLLYFLVGYYLGKNGSEKEKKI